MEHGSESYYVLGEGLLGESLGGREPTLARTAEAVTPPFRFSRMGPKGGGKQIPEGARKALADAMAVAGGGSVGVPAGFTYLGQFIDHDLTFDKTNVMLGSTSLRPSSSRPVLRASTSTHSTAQAREIPNRNRSTRPTGST
jgi:hypothetical protein